MKSMKTVLIIFLSILIAISQVKTKQVTIKCWPTMMTEDIEHGRIVSASANMSCRIIDRFDRDEKLEVTSMVGLNREYENLFLQLNFDFRYQNLPRELPKGIGRVVAQSHGHRLKAFGIDSQLNLKEINRECFTNMPELEMLKILKNSKINEIPFDTFHDLTNLFELSLDGNSLKNLHVDLLKNLIFLEDFSATSNPIEAIEEHLFRNNKNLKTVDFTDTQIRRINVDFQKLHNLQIIKVKTDAKCQILMDSSISIVDAQKNVVDLCRN